jgi:hypothetical protein
MRGLLFVCFLVIFVLSACSPSTTLAPEPTKSATLFLGTPMPPIATFAPTPTYAPLMEQTISIEYASVSEALTDLKTRKDVAVVVKQGWTMVIEADGYTTWTFTPSDDPAYPTLAKRTLYQDQNGWHIAMRVACEADKEACNQFVQKFQLLNMQMLQHLEPQRAP